VLPEPTAENWFLFSNCFGGLAHSAAARRPVVLCHHSVAQDRREKLLVGQREYWQRQRPYGILYPGFFFWEFHDAECTSADRISSSFLRLAILTLGKGKHANVLHLLHLQMLPDSVVLSAARRFRTTFSAALRTARRRGDQLCFQRWAPGICHEILTNVEHLEYSRAFQSVRSHYGSVFQCVFGDPTLRTT